MKLMILDGNSIVNRAFYGIRMLNAPDGTPTNAVYGFLTIFQRILELEQPQAVCVAFDVHAPTFRHEQYAPYKAQRKPMPEELRVQVPVLKEVLDCLAPQAASCEVEISGECQGVCLQASLKQMRELLLNLMSNGIKYNHPGGHVWTKIRQEKDVVCIEVKDDGVGIEPEDQKRIFERFFRVDKGRSRKMGGTGLGLSIVKHIAAYYGGSVSLESTPGAGSTFRVEIPTSGISGQ